MTAIAWLQTYSPALQALTGLVLALLTIVLVVVTVVYANAARRQAAEAHHQALETGKQADVMERQRLDAQRPILHPMGRLSLADGNTLDMHQARLTVLLENVGLGVALKICGEIFGPTPKDPPQSLPPRLTLWRLPTLRASEREELSFEQGMTLMDGTVTIGDYALYAPPRPARLDMVSTEYNVVARLTLTFEDVFGRKHAGVFDYIDLYGWQCTALLQEPDHDLNALDDDARNALRVAMERSRQDKLSPVPV